MTSIPIAVRSSSGLSLTQGPPSFENVEGFCPVQILMELILHTLKIVKTDSWEDVTTIENTKAYHLAFSPKSTFLMSWEPFTVSNANPEGTPNLNIYRSEDGHLRNLSGVQTKNCLLE
ncbi:hypothetical protein NQ318_020231 [Aromia moschata]|uniref:Uncharacterized protein n=1 Tax=Aromia moschata TaxID=1265417 RepID=A0AAV8ZBG0_9CUCU|nr:hypothetical protein NQ318_020231 [Aromia moschata]